MLERPLICPKDCYCECRLQADPALATVPFHGCPFFGLELPIEFLTGTKRLSTESPASRHWVEIDGYEMFPTGNGVVSPLLDGLHEVTISGASRSATETENNAVVFGAPSVDANFHTYAFLYHAPSLHNGTGSFSWYMDGTLNRTVFFTATTGSNPAASHRTQLVFLVRCKLSII